MQYAYSIISQSSRQKITTQMLIAAKSNQLPEGSQLLPLTQKIFLCQSSKQFFKISEFERSACFNGDTLSEPRLMTFTIYDPVFLAIEKCWALQPATPVPLTSLVDEPDLHLLPYIESSFGKICETVERGSSTYYKPSLDKIMSIVQAKYRKMVQACQDKQIPIRKLGLETVQELSTMSPIVEGILRQDLDEFFITELKRRCGFTGEKPRVQREVVQDNFREQPENKKKRQSSSKPETKREKEMKHEKYSNKSITSFFNPTPKKE